MRKYDTHADMADELMLADRGDQSRGRARDPSPARLKRPRGRHGMRCLEIHRRQLRVIDAVTQEGFDRSPAVLSGFFFYATTLSGD